MKNQKYFFAFLLAAVAGLIATFSLMATAPVANAATNGNGTGLKGEYFDNIDFTNQKLTRTDAVVNFNWGTGSPNAAIGPDTFSVRWTGQVMPRYTQTYSFNTISDDGVRLWVNGQLLIDNWTNHAPVENSGAIALNSGQKYDIKLEFFENGGGATAQLFWSSASQPKEIVPQSQLFLPATDPNGLDAEEASFLNLINQYRAANGKPALTINPNLESSSRWMSQDMASKNYFSHTDSLGRDPFVRMAAFGYNFNTYKGENIAAGYVDAASVMQGWKNSAGHNANMLNGNYHTIGIARAYNANSTYKWYWTTDFGGQ
ncbi:MAG TPA: PA14 domain-containing protein [Chloroflexia bacterium]|nr:PA14 domain-containing protein [Chloroflexia bacterium]